MSLIRAIKQWWKGPQSLDMRPLETRAKEDYSTPRKPKARFEAVLTIVHDSLPKPVVHRNEIKAISVAQVLSHMNLTAKQACDIKNRGSTTWTDQNGAVHKLELIDNHKEKAHA